MRAGAARGCPGALRAIGGPSGGLPGGPAGRGIVRSLFSLSPICSNAVLLQVWTVFPALREVIEGLLYVLLSP